MRVLTRELLPFVIPARRGADADECRRETNTHLSCQAYLPSAQIERDRRISDDPSGMVRESLDVTRRRGVP